MSAAYPVGVVGAARHATSVAEELLASPDLRLAGWGLPAAESVGAADPPGGIDAFVPWHEVVRDPELVAVVILDGDDAYAAADAAVSAGKAVLCLRPPTGEDLPFASSGQGERLVLYPSRMRHTTAGAHAIEAVLAGDLGELHSAFVSLRGRAGTGVDALLWEALDVVVALGRAPVARVHAVSGSGLVTCIVVFGDGLVVTVDVSANLPASTPDTSEGEAEIELVGARKLLRVEPYRTSVHVHGAAGTSLLPFGEDPIRPMLADLATALRSPVRRAEEQARLSGVLDLRNTVVAAARRGLGSWTAPDS